MYLLFFFFNDTATTEIYTLSLHDALPIYLAQGFQVVAEVGTAAVVLETDDLAPGAVLRAADAREDVADQALLVGSPRLGVQIEDAYPWKLVALGGLVGVEIGRASCRERV